MRGRKSPLPPSDRAFYRAVAQAIKDIRVVQGLTKEELAGHTGLTRTSIVNIEAGRQRPQLHVLMLIAQGLDVPYWSLIPEHQMPKPRMTVRLVAGD